MTRPLARMLRSVCVRRSSERRRVFGPRASAQFMIIVYGQPSSPTVATTTILPPARCSTRSGGISSPRRSVIRAHFPRGRFFGGGGLRGEVRAGGFDAFGCGRLAARADCGGFFCRGLIG